MQNFNLRKWPPRLVYSKTAVTSLETITGRANRAKSQSERVLRLVSLSRKFESVILLLQWAVKTFAQALTAFDIFGPQSASEKAACENLLCKIQKNKKNLHRLWISALLETYSMHACKSTFLALHAC